MRETDVYFWKSLMKITPYVVQTAFSKMKLPEVENNIIYNRRQKD